MGRKGIVGPGGKRRAASKSGGRDKLLNAVQGEIEKRIADLQKSESPSKEAKAAKAPKDANPKRMSALDAAAIVLAEAGPMGAKTMIETMAAKGLWSSPGGKTPEATLYAAITREIQTKGDASRFARHDRGLFCLVGGAR